MKQKKMVMFVALLCVIFVFSGCGGGNQPAVSNQSSEQSSDQDSHQVEKKNQTDLNTISDFADAWNERYNMNESTINSSDEIILELVVPGTEFISGVQYDLLNMDNKDGRFEGELMMAGYPGFLERNDSKMTFGYDLIREEDGFGPSMKAGDRIAENGSCDLKKGTYQTETFTERNGQQISHNYSEFKLLESGKMICLVTTSSGLDGMGVQKLSNTSIYIKAGEEQFDFIIGKAEQGPAFEKISFIDKDDLSKDEARQMMEAAGYKIEKSGGISDGALVID